ncbi:MAG: PilZ domain-containing protein [Treponema sp.]|jgi:hypothetical protein|nr:PilZ domain-containing protein [Treponema sp.]
MINDKRKHPRYPAQARVRIPEVFDGEALLKDISITGCGIESTMLIDVKSGDQFNMEIICESASKIGNFEIQVEAKWVRMRDCACEVGFAITASPVGKQFQRYVDYLAFRSNSK